MTCINSSRDLISFSREQYHNVAADLYRSAVVIIEGQDAVCIRGIPFPFVFFILVGEGLVFRKIIFLIDLRIFLARKFIAVILIGIKTDTSRCVQF